MSDIEFLTAKITLPELEGKVLNGSLHLKGKEKFVIIDEMPYKDNYWKAIEILYAETEAGFYTCIHCAIYKANFPKGQYLISEFYQGKIKEDSSSSVYKKLTAEVFYLNQWLRPKLIEFKRPHETYTLALSALNNKKYSFTISHNFVLIFESGITYRAQYGKIDINEKSFLTISTESSSTRSELFSFFYYFLIFFVLFIKKTPRTSDLSFFTDEEEFKLLGLPEQDDKSEFIALLEFDEMKNLDKVISNYYEKSSQYAEIIQLLEKSIDITNPEICFLHLTQGLELLHKTFFETDKSIEKTIAQETDSLFTSTQKNKSWNQIMRYYHLYKIALEENMGIAFPSDHVNFIKCIRNSRNYYTHYEKKGNIWKYMELYKINNILQVWLRSIVLFNLEISNDNIFKSSRRELRSFREDDIFENKYSMRYKNYFAK